MAKKRRSAAQRAATARMRAGLRRSHDRRRGLTLPSMDEFVGPLMPLDEFARPGSVGGHGRPRAPISSRAAKIRSLRAKSKTVVDDFGNLVSQVPIVGPLVAPLLTGIGNAVGGAVSTVTETVTGTVSGATRGRGRPRGVHRPFDFIKGRRIGKTKKSALMRLGAPNVSRGARGIIKINPVSGSGVAAIVTGALGAGAGYVVATKAVPSLVGRFMPAAAQGLIGAVVGAVGGVVIGKLIGKKVNARVGSMVATGSLVALGVALMARLVQMLPSSVTAPIGLSGMRDYIQLSGPVPAQLFADGGMQGFSDYVDFQNPAAGRVAEAASAAITEWTPGASEQF